MSFPHRQVTLQHLHMLAWAGAFANLQMKGP